jgi:hypothetical protein
MARLAWEELSDTQLRQLQNIVLGVLLTIAGTLFMLLWNQQQGIIMELSNRIASVETICRSF